MWCKRLNYLMECIALFNPEGRTCAFKHAIRTQYNIKCGDVILKETWKADKVLQEK